MAKDFVKAYRNFLKYEENATEMQESKQKKGKSPQGLLSPNRIKKKEMPASNEMDVVMGYVREIRKYRNITNGD